MGDRSQQGGALSQASYRPQTANPTPNVPISKQGSVAEALQTLNQEIEHLSQQQMMLLDRLDPVLEVRPPRPNDVANASPSMGCLLAQSIWDRARQVGESRRVIEEILSRLQL